MTVTIIFEYMYDLMQLRCINIVSEPSVTSVSMVLFPNTSSHARIYPVEHL